MLLALQDKSLFASCKFWSDLVMVGQGQLMPGQMPGSGYASGFVIVLQMDFSRLFREKYIVR